jgi:hypothetical protein
MALVPHKITALAESDAQGTDGKNIVAGAVVSLYDTNGTAVTLFDDESGSNGSTAKQTDATGQVVVYVTAGEYDEEVNGSVKRRVLIGNKELTTEQLIDSVRNYREGDVITTTGFASDGDGGVAQWKATATTGLTPSQTPVDRGAAELVDGSGRLWELSSPLSLKKIGAKGVGSDDTAFIDTALKVGGSIEVDEGVFGYSRLVNIEGDTTLFGKDRNACILKDISSFSDFNFIVNKNISANSERLDKNILITGICFDGGNVTTHRWLQNWSDFSDIVDPQNDYFENGGGIGNVAPAYIRDDSYFATGATETNVTLNENTMPQTRSVSGGPLGAYSRRVGITTTTDESAITATVTGTDYKDNLITQDVSLPNSGYAFGTKWFKTVTSITLDSAPSAAVSYGIEPFDIGSAASAGRRNPDYINLQNSILSLGKVENFKIEDCKFINHAGRAITELGGKQVIIQNNYFENVGKDDGPFHAIFTKCYGNVNTKPTFFQDSEEIVIKNNTALNLERGLVIFTPTKGGVCSGNTISGFKETAILPGADINFSGGYSYINDNTIIKGRISDIACSGIEAAGAKNMQISGNYINDTDFNAMTLTGCRNTHVFGNTLLDCANAITYPYGPFSERYDFNVGGNPIAGTERGFSDQLVVAVGTDEGVGCDSVIFEKNKLVETRFPQPERYFAQTKSGASNQAKEMYIRDNIVNIPSGMNFFDDTYTVNVWDSSMSLQISNNIGHLSEYPQAALLSLGTDDTGVKEIKCGFRPRRVDVYAQRNNAASGQSYIGNFWYSGGDGESKSTGLLQAFDNTTGQYIAVTQNDIARIKDESGLDVLLIEFGEWKELGFTVDCQTVSVGFTVRFICHS